jgi:WD40 repeat protein
VAFSSRGDILAVGWQAQKARDQPKERTGGVVLLDARTGKPVTTLDGELNWVSEVAFAPDGRTLAAAGHDGKAGRVRLWKATQ